jgi:hypothetical protein
MTATGWAVGTRALASCFVLVVVGVVSAPSALAAYAALNGRFMAQSNGDWATSNDIFHEEASTRSTWTITMTCTNVVTCAGKVTSDAGWTADISTSNGEYIVQRELPNWEPCADGRTVTGHQRYRFYPVDDLGALRPGSPVFAGFDHTAGVSGGCSLNQKLEIELPFRMERLDASANE